MAFTLHRAFEPEKATWSVGTNVPPGTCVVPGGRLWMRTFGRYLVTCTSGQELKDLFPVLPWTNIKVKSILNPLQDGSVSQLKGLLSESNIMNANWLSNSKLVIEWLEKWLHSRELQFDSQHPHQDVLPSVGIALRCLWYIYFHLIINFLRQSAVSCIFYILGI